MSKKKTKAAPEKKEEVVIPVPPPPPANETPPNPKPSEPQKVFTDSAIPFAAIVGLNTDKQLC